MLVHGIEPSTCPLLIWRGYLYHSVIRAVLFNSIKTEILLTVIQEYCQRNFLLGAFDVPLTGVGAVWLTDGGPIRRRRLMPYGDMPAKVKGLQVVCKVRHP